MRGGRGPGPAWWRKLTPEQEAAIAKVLALQRPRAQTLIRGALAAEYGVSIRTIDRIRERGARAFARVEIGEWAATFSLDPDDGLPFQSTPWVPK